MKLRKGFVSNSSSVSYTCELCGASEGGWDSNGIEDYGFFRCENGHEICFSCVSEKEIDDILQEIGDNIDEEDYYNEVPAFACPICRFEVASNSDLVRYLAKETGITKEEVLVEIKKINKRRRKVYDAEYIAYASHAKEIDVKALVEEWRINFSDYKDFQKYLGGK